MRNRMQNRNGNATPPHCCRKGCRKDNSGNGKADCKTLEDNSLVEWQLRMDARLRRRLRDGSCLNQTAEAEAPQNVHPASHSSLSEEDATAGEQQETPCI